MASLLKRGYSVNVVLEDEATHHLATVRLNCPPPEAAPLLLDLLFATSGIEPEIVKAATVETVLPAVRMPVARTGHLLAMKVLADKEGREHDAGDIHRLLEVADEREIYQAQVALQLIMDRGFSRNKDLSAEFDQYIERFRRAQAERPS